MEEKRTIIVGEESQFTASVVEPFLEARNNFFQYCNSLARGQGHDLWLTSLLEEVGLISYDPLDIRMVRHGEDDVIETIPSADIQQLTAFLGELSGTAHISA